MTDSNNSSWQSSPLRTPDDALSSANIPGYHDPHFMRRGSLPAGELFPLPDQSPLYPAFAGSVNPFSRRRSVDASLHRLHSNPYAPLARAKNGMIGSRISSQPKGRPHQLMKQSLLPGHPGSDSASLSMHTRHSSMDGRHFRLPAASISPSPSPLSSAHLAVRGSLPDNNLYAFSSRQVCSPIPGPLPSPDFSFGAPSSNGSK